MWNEAEYAYWWISESPKLKNGHITVKKRLLLGRLKIQWFRIKVWNLSCDWLRRICIEIFWFFDSMTFSNTYLHIGFEIFIEKSDEKKRNGEKDTDNPYLHSFDLNVIAPFLVPMGTHEETYARLNVGMHSLLSRTRTRTCTLFRK